MSAATLPTTLEAAHQLIEQLPWRVAESEKELFGPSSERKADLRFSKEQILLSLFPPAAPHFREREVCVLKALISIPATICLLQKRLQPS